MNGYTFKEYNDEALRNEGDLNAMLRTLTGWDSHFYEQHLGKSASDLLEVCLDHMCSKSTFDNIANMQECMIETINQRLKDIHAWLTKSRTSRYIITFAFDDKTYRDPDDPYDYNAHQKGILYDATMGKSESWKPIRSAWCLNGTT